MAAETREALLPEGRQTPAATKFILVAVLVLTALVDVHIARQRPLEASTAASALTFFTILFLMRVVGQVLVAVWSPRWLPPMSGENWNLVPYRLLLPAQLAIAAFMIVLVQCVASESGILGTRRSGAGIVMYALAAFYAVVMAARYVVRMTRRPGERWFGGTIPIVFHMVLASFLFVWGRFHVAR